MVCHRMGDNQPSQNQFKNSKILASNFQDFQNFKKVPGIPKFSKNPKSSPLCFGQIPSARSGNFGKKGFLELLEILEPPNFKKFQKVRPYVLAKSRPLGLGILEILENFGIFENFGILGIDFQEG